MWLAWFTIFPPSPPPPFPKALVTQAVVTQPVYLGTYHTYLTIHTDNIQVFLTTPHSFALVNLKPLLPGHVLVCPTRPHRRLTDLSAPEVTDLFVTVQRVQRMLARHYFRPSSPSPLPTTTTTTTTSSTPPRPSDQTGVDDGRGGSFNIAVQDGPGAGQTVAHVHVHVIPRVAGLSSKPDDGTAADEVYEQMAGEEGNVGGALWDRDAAAAGGKGRPRPGGAFDRIEDRDREARSLAVMEAEAEVYRGVLRELEGEGELR